MPRCPEPRLKHVYSGTTWSTIEREQEASTSLCELFILARYFSSRSSEECCSRGALEEDELNDRESRLIIVIYLESSPFEKFLRGCCSTRTSGHAAGSLVGDERVGSWDNLCKIHTELPTYVIYLFMGAGVAQK